MRSNNFQDHSNIRRLPSRRNSLSFTFSTEEILKEAIVPDFTVIDYTPNTNDSYMLIRYNKQRMTPIATAIAAVLSILPNLTVLHLSDLKEIDGYRKPSSLIALLRYVFCPTLEEFQLSLAVEGNCTRASMSHFLERHPRIGKATLCFGWNAELQVALDVPLKMPKMQYYEAPTGYFKCLSNQTPLLHASMNCFHLDIYHSEVDMELGEGLINLKTFSSLKTLTINLGTRLSPKQIITYVASHLSRIEELEIRHHMHPIKTTPEVSPLSARRPVI